MAESDVSGGCGSDQSWVGVVETTKRKVVIVMEGLGVRSHEDAHASR